MQRISLTLLALLLFPLSAFAQLQPGSPTVLILGTNRGVGLECARQYAELGWNVIATSHHAPDETVMAPVREIAARHPKVVLERLDVTDTAMIRALAQKYRDQPIDVLLLNGPSVQDIFAADLRGATEAYDKIDFDATRRDFDIHTLGPMRVAQAFASNVEHSKQKKIATITAVAGSLGAGLPDALAMNFSADKAALNKYMVMLAAAVKPKGVLVGLYQSAVAGPTPADIASTGGNAPVDREVTKLIRQIDALDLTRSGRVTNFTTGRVDPL